MPTGAGATGGHGFPGREQPQRELAPTLPLLIPGVGAQGGDAAATVQAGWRGDGAGATTGAVIVNSSRAILYAGEGTDFADAARAAALATRDALNRARAA